MKCKKDYSYKQDTGEVVHYGVYPGKVLVVLFLFFKDLCSEGKTGMMMVAIRRQVTCSLTYRIAIQ